MKRYSALFSLHSILQCAGFPPCRCTWWMSKVSCSLSNRKPEITRGILSLWSVCLCRHTNFFYAPQGKRNIENRRTAQSFAYSKQNSHANALHIWLDSVFARKGEIKVLPSSNPHMVRSLPARTCSLLKGHTQHSCEETEMHRQMCSWLHFMPRSSQLSVTCREKFTRRHVTAEECCVF